MNKISRRDMLKGLGLTAAGAALAACAPRIVKETVIVEVEKPVEKVVQEIVRETVIVEGTPKVVEKTVTKIVEQVIKTQDRTFLRYGTHGFGAQLPNFMRLLDAFNESQEEYYASLEAKPWGEYWQAVETQAAAGIAPDVLWSGRKAHVHFIEGGALLDVTAYIERDGIDLNDWFGGDGGFSWKGRHYGMPFGNGGVILWVNKTLFDEEGLDYPNADWTWDDFRQAAQALTKDKNGDGVIDQWGSNIHTGWGEAGWMPVVLSNGGQWVNGMKFQDGQGWWDLPAEPIKYFFDEALLQGLEWHAENVCELGIQPKPGEVTMAPGITDYFAGQVVAMQTHGDWMTTVYRDIRDFEWDMVEIPKSPFTNKRMTTYNLMPHWATTSSKFPEGAYTLCKWLAMDDAQAIVGREKTKIPCLKRAMDAYSNPPPENVKIVGELTDYGWSLVTEAYPGNSEVATAWQAEIDFGFLCEKPMSEALQAATDAANAVLATL